MAIITTIELSNGINLDAAYLRVEHVVGNKNVLDAIVRIYFNQEVAHTSVHVDERIFTFTPNDNETALRWDAQTYEHIKTLEEFANVIDA